MIMTNNKDLLSDDELMESRKELSEEELSSILNRKFVFITPHGKEISATVAEIDEALGNNELERILLNNNISESRKNELIPERISKYLAYTLGYPIEDVRAISGEKEARELLQKAMDNYLDEYVDYDFTFGIVSIQRRDLPLLRNCYVNAVVAMIYMILVNFFPTAFIGSNVMFYIGTFLNVLTIFNVLKLSVRLWGLTIK